MAYLVVPIGLDGLAGEDYHKSGLETDACTGGHAVEEGVIADAGTADSLVELHRRLGGQRRPVINEVLSDGGRQSGLLNVVAFWCGQATARDDLVHKRNVVVDLEVHGTVDLAVVQHVLNGNLPVVLREEVVERYRRFEPDETARKLVDHGAAASEGGEKIGGDETIVEPLPATAGRVLLVRFEVALMFKVLRVLIDEVPNLGGDVILSPREPILHGRFYVEHGPAIKLGRVHLANLIAGAMLATVDGSEDQRVLVERMAVDLAAIGEFEEALPNLSRGAVDLIDEEDDRTGTSGEEPVGSVPSRRTLAADGRGSGSGQAKQIALGHLRSAALNDGQAKVAGDLVDDLGLADAVATTEEDGLANLRDEGGDRDERGEVNGH